LIVESTLINVYGDRYRVEHTVEVNMRIASGLQGVVVTETELSRVDGEAGALVLRGHRVGDIAAEAGFGAVCGLMWRGEMEAGPAIERALGEARVAAHRMLPALGDALGAPDGMEALRAAMGHLTVDDADASLTAITGAMAVFAAAQSRVRRGLPVLTPDPVASHAADLLRLLTGGAEPAAADALRRYLVTVVDHGMNASTFTARVVASTGSDTVSAVVAALGALKGPLHGGAPGPVLDMRDAIGAADPARARAWLEAELAAGRRIMGMGHRVYRVRDPRAAVLEAGVAKLAEAGLARDRLALAATVEAEAAALLKARYPDRVLAANVEFMTAVILDAIGVDRRDFTPLFACGRVVGWLGHVLEQRREARLIRPRAHYVGPEPRAA